MSEIILLRHLKDIAKETMSHKDIRSVVAISAPALYQFTNTTTAWRFTNTMFPISGILQLHNK